MENLRVIHALRKGLGDEIELKVWLNQRLVIIKQIPVGWYAEILKALELISLSDDELEARGLERLPLEHLDTFAPLGIEWQ